MLLVDNRTGSVELAPHMTLPFMLEELPFGDVCFSGHGAGQVEVVIERKRIRDIMTGKGRFAEVQLPGMSELFNFGWIIIEGIYRPGRDGLLEIPGGMTGGKMAWVPLSVGNRRFMYSELDKWITTMETVVPIETGFQLRVRKTSTVQETVAVIENLYQWWQKDWGEHKAHQQFKSGDHVSVFKPSLVRRVAKELPHIGWEKSKLVEQKFQSVGQMVNADVGVWRKIDGIGAKIATDVHDAIWGTK